MAVYTTYRDLLTDAARIVRVLGPGDDLTDETELFLNTLNLRLNSWNADRRAIYHTVFTVYTLTAGLGPHTIGPTGTLVATTRPESIEGAVPLLSATVRAAPLHLRDEQWWREVSLRSLSTSIPTDLYYAPKWPNGELNFWPVPSTASQMELESRMVLSAVTLDTVVAVPPGYEEALMLTVAEDVAGAFGKDLTATQRQKATLARARVFGNHDAIRRIETRDAGIPGGGGVRGNYQTGWAIR